MIRVYPTQTDRAFNRPRFDLDVYFRFFWLPLRMHTWESRTHRFKRFSRVTWPNVICPRYTGRSPLWIFFQNPEVILPPYGLHGLWVVSMLSPRWLYCFRHKVKAEFATAWTFWPSRGSAVGVLDNFCLRLGGGRFGEVIFECFTTNRPVFFIMCVCANINNVWGDGGELCVYVYVTMYVCVSYWCVCVCVCYS